MLNLSSAHRGRLRWPGTVRQEQQRFRGYDRDEAKQEVFVA